MTHGGTAANSAAAANAFDAFSSNKDSCRLLFDTRQQPFSLTISDNQALTPFCPSSDKAKR